MGKGYVVNATQFATEFLTEIKTVLKEDYECEENEEVLSEEESERLGDFFLEIVKKMVRLITKDPTIDVYPLGHDAFVGGDGPFKCLFPKEISDDFLKTLEDTQNDLEIYTGCKYLFIGYGRELCTDNQEELSYHPKTSEVIYSLAALFPDMMKAFDEFKNKNFDHVAELMKRLWGGKTLVPATIWTFTTDCACCG